MNRDCLRHDGKPKACYKTFDDAMEIVSQSMRNSRGEETRMHAYTCKEHGWHLGSNRLRKSA